MTEPQAHARYIEASYDPRAMTAHHLREYVRMLDAAAVPDDAVVYVHPTVNREVGMVSFRCDLDDDQDMLDQWAADPG